LSGIFMIVEILKVGKKGEIFTTKRIREALKLQPDTYVTASIVGDKLVIRRIPSLEELLSKYYVEVDWREVEELSESIQEGAINRG